MFRHKDRQEGDWDLHDFIRITFIELNLWIRQKKSLVAMIKQ